MLPTADQVRDAAYDRWQRRGGAHGFDRLDWLRAEQDLLFAMNYTVVARVGSEPAAHSSGNGEAQGPGSGPGPRICRFCEQSAPRARFTRPSCAGPVLRDDGTRLTLCVPDECDECRGLFEESFESDLSRFAHPIRAGWGSGDPLPTTLVSPPYVPIAAFKGLTRMALACLPTSELSAFEDAIEWINNPEHDFDALAFGPLTSDIHIFDEPFPTPRATLSFRNDDDSPMPFALFHLADGRGLFQIAVPLCGRDEDLDGHATIVPHAAPLLVTGRTDDPIASATVSMISPRATRETWIGSL